MNNDLAFRMGVADQLYHHGYRPAHWFDENDKKLYGFGFAYARDYNQLKVKQT